MKLLSLKINNSINCVINFDNPNRYAKTYIVNNMSNDPVLFSLQTASQNGRTAYALQTERGRKDLTLLSIEDVKNDVSDMSETVTNVSTENLISRTLTLKFLTKDFISADIPNEQKDRIDKEIHEYKKSSSPFKIRKHGEFLCIADSNKIVEYTIVLTIVAVSECGNFRETSSSLKIVLCPRKNIYQATLDFGSEASQALQYNCDDAKISGNNILPLFSQLASTLGKDIVMDERHPDYTSHNIRYVQFDKDKHLFRSHFLAPCYVDITKDDFIPAKSPKENPHLKLLTTFTEIEMLKTKNPSASGEYTKTYFTLPNVKIASLTHDRPTVTVKTNNGEGPIDATEFRHRYFYRSAINSFIYQVLKNTAIKAEEEKTIAYLRLTILMPNVYNQKDLSIRMRDINEDINGLLNLAEFSGVIRGVEVNSISESDASILGFMNANSKKALTLRKGNYLIIDAGKGTLDFSVLRFDPQAVGQVFLSLYRSGIVGSGNAISYAVFLDLISHLLSSDLYKVPQEYIETGVKAIVRDLIMSGEEATLAELMKYVERYKRYYGETCHKKESGIKKSVAPIEKNNISTQCTFLYDKETNLLEILKKHGSNVEKQTISLQKDIVEWIKNLFESPNNLESSSVKPEAPTELLYTERMINQLKDDALKAFGYIGKLDYIVMSGRAFHLPQFRDAIFSGIKSVPLWANAQLIQWEDTNQVINAKNICLYANQMLSHGKYDGRAVGRPVLIKHGESPILYKTDEEKAEMSKFIARLNGNKYTQWAVGPCMAITNKIKGAKPKETFARLFGDHHAPAMMCDKDYLKGVRIQIDSTLDQIAISGTNYTLPGNAKVKTPATIYFDGDEFLYVCNNTAQDFDPVVSPSVFHVFESTFPYGFTSGDIPIPKQLVMKSTLEPVEAEKRKQENNQQKDLTKDL